MKCVVIFLLTSVGLVLAFHENRQHPAIEYLYDYQNDVNENSDHEIFKKSIDTNQQFYQNDLKSEEKVQEPCRLNLPTLEDLSADFSQDIYKDDGVPDYVPTGVYPPRVPSYPYNVPYEKWTQYDIDYLLQDPLDYRAAYNAYNMPYLYNPVPTVKSLPPVTTRIHETLSPMTHDEYDIDNDSEVYFPPYVRAVRSRNDFLEQLREDAVMPNILPTMPFPYMRTALPSYQPHSQSYLPHRGPTYQNKPVSFFPSAPQSDCALPLLVSCSPKISYGSLTNGHGGYSGKPVIAPTVPSVPTYRKESKAETSPSKVH